MIMILTVFNFGFQTYQTGSSVFEWRENKPSGKLKALTNQVLRPVHEIVLLVLNFSLPLFLILVTCSPQVMCVGPTGSGKTLCVANKLLNNMPKEFLSHFLNFSARTSANQTQDIIDSNWTRGMADQCFASCLLEYSSIFQLWQPLIIVQERKKKGI